MGSAVVIALVGLIVAAAVPDYSPVDRTLARLWREGRAPLTTTEDHFARLFSGVLSKKDQPGRFFGDSLPFQGAISFGGEVVFWAGSDYPSYWLSQTYSQYTPEGWLAGETQQVEAGPEVLAPPRGDDLDRIPVEQSIQLNFSTDNLLSGGGLEWVSREAELSMLAPKKFEVEIADPGKDSELPEDIQELASELRVRFEEGQEEEFIEATVTRMLPEDLVLTEAHYLVEPDSDDEDRSLKSITLARKDPISPEIVAWRFADEVPKEDAYFMTSYVSVADDDTLRAAGEDYSTHITDHYLQLPASMPTERSRDLAEIRNSGVLRRPWTRPSAIQGFLQRPRLHILPGHRGASCRFRRCGPLPVREPSWVQRLLRLVDGRDAPSGGCAEPLGRRLRPRPVPRGVRPKVHQRLRQPRMGAGLFSGIRLDRLRAYPRMARPCARPDCRGGCRGNRRAQMSPVAGSRSTTSMSCWAWRNLNREPDPSFLGLPTVTDSRFNPLRYLVPLAIVVCVRIRALGSSQG